MPRATAASKSLSSFAAIGNNVSPVSSSCKKRCFPMASSACRVVAKLIKRFESTRYCASSMDVVSLWMPAGVTPRYCQSHAMLTASGAPSARPRSFINSALASRWQSPAGSSSVPSLRNACIRPLLMWTCWPGLRIKTDGQ